MIYFGELAIMLACAVGLYLTMRWGRKCKHGVHFLCSECRNGDNQQEIDEFTYQYGEEILNAYEEGTRTLLGRRKYP